MYSVIYGMQVWQCGSMTMYGSMTIWQYRCMMYGCMMYDVWEYDVWVYDVWVYDVWVYDV